jgi:hypothetical protein
LSVARDSPLSDEDLCNAVLECGPVTDPVFNWTITLPNVPKPPIKPLVPPKVNKTYITYRIIFDDTIICEYILL